MCLGIPGRVVEMVEGYGNQLAMVDMGGDRRRVNIGMLEDQALNTGDWILVHLGFAVERLDAAGAEHATAALEMMSSPGAGHPSHLEDPEVPPPLPDAPEVAALQSGRLPHA